MWESATRSTFLILIYVTSRLVPLLNIIDASVQIPNVVNFALSYMFLNFSSQIFLLFIPEMSANFSSYTVQIIYITLAWILYPLHFCPLLLIQKPKHSSSNQGLCCFHSCIPRLSFAEIWILCLMFPQILFTSSSLFKFWNLWYANM